MLEYICQSTISDNHTNDGTGIGSFTSGITGLNPGTTYHVRTYANNTAGTGYGSDLTFTSSAIIPTVTTTVSSIASTSAISGGNVISDGGASVTVRGVCWSTSENPTIIDSHTTDGLGTGSFTSSIMGLNQGATYHVRAYATNSVGTAYGADVEFTTLALGSGSLRVNLAPQSAVDASVKWKMDGGAWQDGGATLSEIGDGEHTLYFKDVDGWIPPAMRTVTILSDQLIEYQAFTSGDREGFAIQARSSATTTKTRFRARGWERTFTARTANTPSTRLLTPNSMPPAMTCPITATEWVMVRDNVTGLIWEVKQNQNAVTNYDDPHDADNNYTWYDSNPETNGGNAGTPGDARTSKTSSLP